MEPRDLLSRLKEKGGSDLRVVAGLLLLPR